MCRQKLATFRQLCSRALRLDTSLLGDTWNLTMGQFSVGLAQWPLCLNKDFCSQETVELGLMHQPV